LGAIVQSRAWVGICASLALAGHALPAFAQRADENIVKAAEDAFGARIGGENIGLYNANSTRGFNASQAGNVRIEGLYFDQPGFIGRAVIPRTTIRVGLSAQSYPFPAPTGIVDSALSIPGDKATWSLVNEFRRPSGSNINLLETEQPITAKMSASLAIGASRIYNDGGVFQNLYSISSVARLRPTADFELVPVVFYQKTTSAEVAPSIFTGGAYLPPRVDRGVFAGQHWADRGNDDFTYGALARGNASENWTLQASLFKSGLIRPDNYVVFFRGVQPDGRGTLDILRYPEHSSISISGEARATGVFTGSTLRHTVHLSTRGRDTRRFFGGGATTAYGPATIGVARDVAPPATWNFGVRDQDDVRQITPGVSYALQWANVGEASLGLQKSFYHRDFGKENAAPQATESRPWLYNGTLAWYATPQLAFYSGYTRGLEDFGTAPDNTVNAGEPLPAQLTEQVDAGVRYTIVPGFTFVGGVFEVKKPYFDRDTANVYSVVGDLSHKGVELSLTGQPFTGVNVVAGAVFLKARVSGLSVERGLIGEVSPGTSPRILRLNLQYGAPSWNGFTIEGNIEHEGATVANRANTLKVPSLTTLSVAARYPFALGKVRANVRLQITNITNVFAWTVEGNSGRFTPNAPRVIFVRFAADY